METVIKVNDAVNGFAWGTFGLALLLGTGLICTVITSFFSDNPPEVLVERHLWDHRRKSKGNK